MKLDTINNIKHTLHKPKAINFKGCSSCQISDCKIKNCSLKPEKVAKFDLFKIIGNVIKLIAVGIVLYAGYEQFFDNKNKTESKPLINTIDTFKNQSNHINKYIPSKDTLIKRTNFH